VTNINVGEPEQYQTWYVTFAQKWRRLTHPTYPDAHPDGYVRLVVEDEGQARWLVSQEFGGHFFALYRAQPNAEDYPLGELGEVAHPNVTAQRGTARNGV
jgi:hypothetical protein